MKRIILGLLLLAAAFPSAADAATPEQVVRAFLAALGDADERRAVSLISESAAPLRDAVRDELMIRCTEISSLRVVRSERGPERAEVDTEAVVRRIPRGRGRATELLERRTFRLRPEQGGWRIEAMPSREELLAEEMMKRPQDARGLIAAHPELIGPELVHQMVVAATVRGPRDYRKVQREVVDAAADLASALGDRAGLAYAIAAQLQHEDVPGADRLSRLERAKVAFALAEEADDAEVAYVTGVGLATIHMQLDDTSREMIRIYRRVLEYRGSLRPQQVAVALTNFGQGFYFRQDYATAYQYFTESLRMSPRTATLAQAEVNLGWIMDEQNDPAAAFEHFRRASEVAAPKPFEIMAHLGLARMHRALGRPAEAWREAQKALEIARGTPYKGLIGDCFITLTEMQIGRGEKGEAEGTLKTALQYAREVNAEHVEMNALRTLGNLYYADGRFADALRMAREAEAVWRRFDSPGADRYPILMLAARSELALGHEDEALAGFAEAIASVESVRGSVAGGQRQRVLYFEPFHAAYGEMVSLLLARGRVEEALVYAERGKGRVLLDTLGLQRTSADELMTEDQRAKRGEMIRRLGQANRQVIVLRASEASRASLDAALAEQRSAQQALDEFDLDVESRQPRLRAARGGASIIRPADLDEIVTRSDFAILEYAVHDRWTSLFLVERRGNAAVVTQHRIDVPREALDRQILAYAGQLASRNLGYRPASRALYDLLLGPVARRLAGKRLLCIVPDGTLWHLPFESLLGRDGRFVMEHAAAFYVPSISVYREVTSGGGKLGRRAAIRPVATFGNPAIAEARERIAAVYRASLAPLPDAEREAKAVGRIWGSPGAVYLGRDAREDTAKREMEAARIVHFAAHGLFDDENPMFSEIILAPGAASQEDGVLQAWELMHLDLAADLVVLSACETARGRVGAGEGLIGMSWALFAGGCPSTVATHWKVESRASSRLMIAFHERLRQNGGKAEALRAAQRLLLRDAKTSHPFYWAGFVLIGAGS